MTAFLKVSIALIALARSTLVLASPSGSPYDLNTPHIDFNTDSPGFNALSTLPEQAVDPSGEWTDPRLDLNYGLWDNDGNAHILDPVHPHEAGLPYPTARSRECASVKDLVREGVVGREALLPYIHESLHESVAPSISAPSVNNNWYERQHTQQGQEGQDDNYQDA